MRAVQGVGTPGAGLGALGIGEAQEELRPAVREGEILPVPARAGQLLGRLVAGVGCPVDTRPLLQLHDGGPERIVRRHIGEGEPGVGAFRRPLNLPQEQRR